MMWGFGGFGFLWMALFWIGLILVAVWAVRGTDERRRDPRQALDILEERFARGELETEEFVARRRELAS